jgi:NADH:ubiquinone oxidoreductase subunit F (NADH-binding)/NADH:ubiquinone oxidoreductase subunit E/NAD-dependent dihydropyrimidine dehydrogenase PreA subunit
MSTEEIKKVDGIVDAVGGTNADVIPLLQAIQSEFNYLPEEALLRVTELTEISASKLYSVSSFYSQFRLKPVGKHMINVCVGTACHVKGAMFVYDAFKRNLNIPENEDTDEQGLYTLNKVACLGCCSIAPAVQIDDITYGHVSSEKIDEILEDFQNAVQNPKAKQKVVEGVERHLQGEIRIGLGSCCVASGSADIKQELEKTLQNHKINVDVKQVGCVGVCNQVPMIELEKPGEETAIYSKISADEVRTIVLNHFQPEGRINKLISKFNSLVEGMIYKDVPDTIKRYANNHPNSPITEFLDGQINIATEQRGILKPLDIEEYIKFDGFKALEMAVKNLTPDDIVEKIINSGLRGRGGAGFSTGQKWNLVKSAQSEQKYVICNGDEGDPGAFMDRMLLESYPFRVIEGMIISALAVGASEGIFYIRAEYQLAVKQIKAAIEKAREKGYLGQKILNSDFSFDIKVFEGAGAFICGEETALIASIEGERGFPKLRPPYPAERGLWDKPTLINNTETFSLVSWIIRNGEDKFAEIGTEKSKGTKVFALAGKVKRGGLIEVPMGATINQIVYKIGDGIANNKKFKAIQIGGPSGGCIPAELGETSIDYESLKDAQAMMGSGGLIVLDETDCMVDIARYFLEFTESESCGKCTFCRIGTSKMLEILNNICSGKGKEGDIEKLEQLAVKTINGSLCGLGKTAPNPVLSTIKHFREEYEMHIKGTCPTGKCTDLIEYKINSDCIGCTKCAQVCPSDAIEMKPHEQHEIQVDLCVKCDVCKQICPTEAIYIQ